MSKLPYRQVHLDFHTPTLPFELGKNFEKAIFQQTLLDAHVNAVTLTGRCHHGHIYYETTLAARHPQMKGDFLMQQVDACHEVGIRAPIYITVGWDAFSADQHPEWLERKADGQMYGFEDYGQLAPGWKTLCFNTPYLTYLKEQIRDTMTHFHGKLDGLFFDIVWQDPCCCNDCIEKMLIEGYDPLKGADQRNFARKTEQFLKEEIYQTVHEIDKNCPIFFNEGNILPTIRPNLAEYSHLEIESLPSGEWGYQHFPTVVRYAKKLGKEYVGMTGKFHKVWADFGSYKNQAALEYEIFLALAHGAKCSIGDQMYPDGTLQKATYELVGSVYEQVEQLESYNDETEAVTEIAIVHPGMVAETEEKVDLSLAGAVNMLNEAHYQADVIDHLMDWSTYRVIILPDKLTMNHALSLKVSDYLKNGGKIIASYKSGLNEQQQFMKPWGIEWLAENEFVPTYGVYSDIFQSYLMIDELVLHGPSMNIKPRKTKVFGKEVRPMYQRDYLHYYSHFQAPKGEESGYPVLTVNQEVCYFTHPIFEMYKYHGMKQYKLLVLAALDLLRSGKKVLAIDLPSTADVILNVHKKKQQLVLNVLHYVPQRRAVLLDTIEEKIPLKEVQVTIDLTEISISIGEVITGIEDVLAVQPQQVLSYEQKDNKITVTVPNVDGYQIILFNYQTEGGAVWKD